MVVEVIRGIGIEVAGRPAKGQSPDCCINDV
jgi:hypothetical protein